MKPGIKSTEFWLTLGAGISTTALASFEQVDGTIGVVSVAILTALYTVLRAALKSKISG